MTNYKYVKNAKGMRIRVCCASCMCMAYNEQLKKYCMKGFDCGGKCSEWQMNDTLYNLPKNAVDASVKVKKKAYLDWLANKCEAAYKEWKAKNPEKGRKFPGVNIEKSRKEWLQLSGEKSIYIE